MKSSGLILMDSREPSSYRIALSKAAAKAGYETATDKMDTGDYAICYPDGTTCLIERKEVSDLFHSLQDGRWSQQVPRLVGEAHVPVLLVEGNITYFADDRLNGGRGADAHTASGLDNTLLVGQLAGMAIVRCAHGAPSVVRRILGVAATVSARGVHTTLISKGEKFVRTSQEEAVTLGMLTALPGCGEITASRLVETYGSFANIQEAIYRESIDCRALSISVKWPPVWKRILQWEVPRG